MDAESFKSPSPASRLTRQQELQLQMIADTSVDLDEEEDVAVVAERLARIRKDRGEARRRASDRPWVS